MLDRMIGLTIPSRRNRCWFWKGYNMAKGVPADMLSFWEGMIPLDYGNNFERIADAAEADGFPFVRYFQGYENAMILNQHPAQMCQVWSYAQILRHITESDETTLVLWDDRYLGVPFSVIAYAVAELQSQSLPFYLLQLRIRGVEKNEIDQTAKDNVVRQFFDSIAKPTKIAQTELLGTVITKGMMGLDESIVFTPQGAAWVLEQMQAIEPPADDMKTFGIMDLSPVHQDMYMKCFNIDSWIKADLVPKANKVVKAKEAGIYRALSKEVTFIDEPIAFGSDTHFLTEHVDKNYHFYNNETVLDIINIRRTNVL